MVDTKSVFQCLGLPNEFVVLILSFCFIIFIAPYFEGMDFNIFKVPKLPETMKKFLKYFGPLILIIMIFCCVPTDSIKHCCSDPTHTPTPTARPTITATPINNQFFILDMDTFHSKKQLK